MMPLLARLVVAMLELKQGNARRSVCVHYVHVQRYSNTDTRETLKWKNSMHTMFDIIADECSFLGLFVC